jgi:hypothetical protein
MVYARDEVGKPTPISALQRQTGDKDWLSPVKFCKDLTRPVQ